MSRGDCLLKGWKCAASVELSQVHLLYLSSQIPPSGSLRRAQILRRKIEHMEVRCVSSLITTAQQKKRAY